MTEQLRKEFEAWMATQRNGLLKYSTMYSTARRGKGYVDSITNMLWESWQAARRAEPGQEVEPVAAPAGYFCEPYLNKPGLFEQVFNGFDDPDVIPLYRDPNGRIAALEREVEALRSLLSDVTCVAITMLYDTHKQDVLDEFTMDDLKEVVRRSEHLQIEKVEHIYRRGFKALAGGEAG